MLSRPFLPRLSAPPTVLMLLLSGCGRGDQAPTVTVTQAEQKLAAQTSALVARAKRTGGKDIKVSFQSEGYFQCPKGKARRGVTYTGRIITGERKPPFHVTMLLIGMTEAVGLLGNDAFKVTYARIGAPMARLHNARTYTNLTLNSPETDRLIIQGTTDCLKVK